MLTSIGIDPGLSGYVALVSQEHVLASAPIPTLHITKTRREYDALALRTLLIEMENQGREEGGVHPVVTIEKQQAMPANARGRKQGGASSFRTGWGYGLLVGMTVGLMLRHRTVHPRTWQKDMHRDIVGKDTKSKSIMACQNLYPGESLLATPRCRKPSDGKADAILIARYGLMVEGGQLA